MHSPSSVELQLVLFPLRQESGLTSKYECEVQYKTTYQDKSDRDDMVSGDQLLSGLHESERGRTNDDQ